MAGAELSGLDALIAKVRRAKDFVASAAPAAAEAMQAALRATASAGTSPDGTAWPQRKKDGGNALPDAADAITVRAVGTVLVARIAFPYSIHNNGKGHAPQRQILPSGEMPTSVAEAIKQSLIDSWNAR